MPAGRQGSLRWRPKSPCSKSPRELPSSPTLDSAPGLGCSPLQRNEARPHAVVLVARPRRVAEAGPSSLRPLRRTAGRSGVPSANPAALLKDVNTHTAGALSNEANDSAVELNGRLYFFADDGIHGRELWSTDGTTAGTALLKDINPGSAASDYTAAATANIVKLGNKLLFAADDGVHGSELWISDGTTAGTQLLKNIAPDTPGDPPAGSFVADLTVVGNQAFFTASDGVHGRELWITDGTATGTALVADVNGERSSLHRQNGRLDPTDLTAAGNKLFFAADDGLHGRELWVSDGTAPGTHLVEDLVPDDPGQSIFHAGAAPGESTYFQGKLLFVAEATGDLYATDGTPANTVKLTSGLSTGAMQLTVAGNSLYFLSNGSGGSQLWTTDGTVGGTHRVAGGILSGDSQLTAVGNMLYFIGFDSHSTAGLWRTDGSLAAPTPCRSPR